MNPRKKETLDAQLDRSNHNSPFRALLRWAGNLVLSLAIAGNEFPPGLRQLRICALLRAIGASRCGWCIHPTVPANAILIRIYSFWLGPRHHNSMSFCSPLEMAPLDCAKGCPSRRSLPQPLRCRISGSWCCCLDIRHLWRRRLTQRSVLQLIPLIPCLLAGINPRGKVGLCI